MKKNVFYSVMAVFMMLFVVSCSQDEIVSVNQSGDGIVRLSVNVSGATPTTRANVKVEGYTMRCIMEILDADNQRIGKQLVEEVADDGTASFEYNVADYEGATTYLFWADYLDGDNKSLYSTDNLQAVGYRLNKNVNLFNNAAADAFCAVTEAGASGSTINVTLKRPFTRIAVRTSDVEALGLEGYTTITPSINGANAYNILTEKATGAKTLSLNTGETLTAATGELYFFCYVLTSEDIVKPTTLKFTNSESEEKSISLTADKMKAMGPNVSVSLTPDKEDPSEPTDETVNVDITIDNEFSGEGGTDTPGTGDDEETPSASFAVGDYINAAGEKVTSESEAVAVVFYVGTGSGDTPAAYGETYANKKIAAYAVALTNGTRGTFGNEDKTTAFPTLTGDADFTSWTGFTKTAALEKMIGDFASVAFANYDKWVSENQLTGSNLSPWYIPSYKQLQTVCDLTFGDKADADFADKLKDTFKTGESNWFYISSTIRDDGKFAAATINESKGTCTTGGADPQPTTSTCIRTVVTIFE